jgi:hypothetical protein
MSTPMTTPQRRFIESLVKERVVTLGFQSPDDAIAAMHLDALDKNQASTIIGRLKIVKRDRDPSLPPLVAASPRNGVNRMAGVCASCGGRVLAREGFFFQANGAWHVHHRNGECLTKEQVIEQALQHAHEHGVCMFCSRDLNDPRSDPLKGGVGYGPVCAQKYGLPWGDKP